MSAGPRLSLRTPLRTALHIGGWSCGIVLLGLMLGVVVAGPGTHRGMLAAVCIAALMNMFWGMVAGSRMVSLVATAWQLRAPHVGRQARAIGLAMLVLVVLLPAAVIALAGDRSFALAACTLAAGALAGVFWVSMPPWRIWVFIVPGVAAGLLPSSPGAPGPGSLLQPDPMATLAVALLAGTVLSCRRAMRFRGTPSACITPIALQLTRSPPLRPARRRERRGVDPHPCHPGRPGPATVPAPGPGHRPGPRLRPQHPAQRTGRAGAGARRGPAVAAGGHGERHGAGLGAGPGHGDRAGAAGTPAGAVLAAAAGPARAGAAARPADAPGAGAGHAGATPAAGPRGVPHWR